MQEERKPWLELSKTKKKNYEKAIVVVGFGEGTRQQRKICPNCHGCRSEVKNRDNTQSEELGGQFQGAVCAASWTLSPSVAPFRVCWGLGNRFLKPLKSTRTHNSTRPQPLLSARSWRWAYKGWLIFKAVSSPRAFHNIKVHVYPFDWILIPVRPRLTSNVLRKVWWKGVCFTAEN